MSDCGRCRNLGYHGIRLDGWPSTIYEYCEHYGHYKPLDCALFLDGEPRYYDKRGLEIAPMELKAIPNPMEVG